MALDHAEAAVLGIVASLTIQGLARILVGTQSPPDGPYEDEDGVASTESESAFSRITPSKLLLNTGAALGLSTAILETSFLTSSAGRAWFACLPFVAITALVSIQATAITFEADHRHARQLCTNGTISATLLLALIVLEKSPLQRPGHQLPWIQVYGALAVLLGFSLLPRRPAVFYRGQQVDRENGASVLETFSFSWSPFHQTGPAVSTTISLGDVPPVPRSQRVRYLKERFLTRGGKTRLWRQLVQTLFSRLTRQWLLVFLDEFFDVATRAFLYRLLRSLESNAIGDGEAWVSVVSLGACLLAETVMANLLRWTTHVKLEMSTVVLLNALVMEKTTRMPLSYGTTTKKRPDHRKSGGQLSPSLTYMMTNDSLAISRAFSHSHHFAMAIFKLLLNMGYLSRLIGAKAVLAGVAASLLSIPFSARLSKRHRMLQAELSKARDSLSSLISEALLGLRQIRLSSLEYVWEARILRSRAHVLDRTLRAALTMAFLTMAAHLGPIFMSSVALSVHALQSTMLGPSAVFASLSLFGNIYEVFRDLPQKVADLHECWISYQRVSQYLDEPEQQQMAIPSEDISLQNGTLAWLELDRSLSSSAGAFALQDVDLTFPRGKLSIVTGKTGSGKSLLLASILEESKLKRGVLRRPVPEKVAEQCSNHNWIVLGTTALVSQPPWIENSTIRDNIVFGCPFDESRYRQVLQCCALDHDLNELGEGDMTKAGMNGAVLSGGQKWRVALARALYSKAEILVLEDVLSAVDAPVARWICTHALTGQIVEGRTRILATHHQELCLAAASYLVLLQAGTATGSKNKDFVIERTAVSDREPTEPSVTAPNNPERKLELPPTVKGRSRQELGRSDQAIFSAYLRASGGLLSCILVVIATLAYQVSSTSHSWWLAEWSSERNSSRYSNLHKITIYLALSIGNGALLVVQSLVISTISLAASQWFFQQMIKSVLRAPLRWIDTTPAGHVLQSLESDMHILDNRTAPEMNGLLGSLIHALFIILSSVVSAPYTVLSSIMLLKTYWDIASRHRALSQKLRRLIPVAHHPLLEQANSIAAGLATVRAFGRRQFYMERLYDLIDTKTKVDWHLALSQRWMDVRLGVLGATFVIITAVAMLLKGTDAATAGFAISLALQLKSALAGALKRRSAMFMSFNAIARALELVETPAERDEGDDPPESWPVNGAIEIQELMVRYDPAMPAALRSISLSVKPRQRIGIVGRTGAGKTTLMNALLRFVEITDGRILIDGLDVSVVSLARLRCTVAIISQDPFLFSGTLRSNLDPNSDKSDTQLLSALRRVQLISDHDGKSGRNSFDNLGMTVRPGGSNLSHGERQLVCLARALLARCRILVLDEAMSAVDTDTDVAIQKVISEEFAESTVLVAVHRLASVATFDSILVLENGQVAECGSPTDLIAKRGVFWNMVRQSGDSRSIEGAIKKK
ncbi:putative ABC bile acid transporter [Thozetella sp. PMI_491]|nr:putative ABC bile acid transporter [Thozetella sp. PMI_491]